MRRISPLPLRERLRSPWSARPRSARSPCLPRLMRAARLRQRVAPPAPARRSPRSTSRIEPCPAPRRPGRMAAERPLGVAREPRRPRRRPSRPRVEAATASRALACRPRTIFAMSALAAAAAIRQRCGSPRPPRRSPRPCSPARAASMLALSDRRLVRSAIMLIVCTMSPISSARLPISFITARGVGHRLADAPEARRSTAPTVAPPSRAVATALGGLARGLDDGDDLPRGGLDLLDGVAALPAASRMICSALCAVACAVARRCSSADRVRLDRRRALLGGDRYLLDRAAISVMLLAVVDALLVERASRCSATPRDRPRASARRSGRGLLDRARHLGRRPCATRSGRRSRRDGPGRCRCDRPPGADLRVRREPRDALRHLLDGGPDLLDGRGVATRRAAAPRRPIRSSRRRRRGAPRWRPRAPRRWRHRLHRAGDLLERDRGRVRRGGELRRRRPSRAGERGSAARRCRPPCASVPLRPRRAASPTRCPVRASACAAAPASSSSPATRPAMAPAPGRRRPARRSRPAGPAAAARAPATVAPCLPRPLLGLLRPRERAIVSAIASAAMILLLTDDPADVDEHDEALARSCATALTNPALSSPMSSGGGRTSPSPMSTTSRALSTRRPTVRPPCWTTMTRESSVGSALREAEADAQIDDRDHAPRICTRPPTYDRAPGTQVAPANDSMWSTSAAERTYSVSATFEDHVQLAHEAHPDERAAARPRPEATLPLRLTRSSTSVGQPIAEIRRASDALHPDERVLERPHHHLLLADHPGHARTRRARRGDGRRAPCARARPRSRRGRSRSTRARPRRGARSAWSRRALRPRPAAWSHRALRPRLAALARGWPHGGAPALRPRLAASSRPALDRGPGRG